MRWASRYSFQHRIPPSAISAQASQPASSRPSLNAFITPKPTLSTHSDTMGWNPFSTSPRRSTHSTHSTHSANGDTMSWNPFSTAPRRRSSYAGSTYSSSSRHHSSTSRYKRSPRDSYIQHLYKKLQHFMREIWRYAQRHPVKVFFMVIMPLVSGGVLTKLARQFGVNLPETGSAHGGRAGLGGSGFSGGRSSAAGGYYGSEGYGMDSPIGGGHSGVGRSSGGGMMGALGNVDLQSVAGGIGGLASLASMASKFM